MDSRKKFFRFYTLAVLSLVLAAAPHARAADESLPPPSSGVEEEVPNANPPAQGDLPEANGETMPAPAAAAGEDILPELPSAAPKEDTSNQHSQGDDIFLPSPAVQDNINYAPIGSSGPLSSQSSIDEDWRSSMNNRPAFLLGLGGDVRTYTDSRARHVPGAMLAASIRVINIAQTIFLHAYGAASIYKIGNLNSYNNVTDTTFQVGGMLEIGIGRRLSLFGSLVHRSSVLSADAAAAGVTQYPTDLSLVQDPSGMQLGAGIQYDFYVIPHGSMGARVQIEKNLAMFLLTMAIEPAPRKKLTLNYDSLE